MKYFIIGFFLLGAGCSSLKSDSALTGIYAASYEHEFGKTDDTLIVKKANEGIGVYQIHRNSGLIKKSEGKEFPKEILTETLTLEFDADKQILKEMRKGKTLIWDNESRTLQLGERKYKKIGN